MPSNPRNRPVISTGQNRMAPSPSGRAPMLPPSPSSPRTLPIDDFIQISDAARSTVGEEVITDLSSFIESAGFTQTTGSFRITEGGVEMASIPRESINRQVNVYVGSMGDEIVDKNLVRPNYTALGVSTGQKTPEGIAGTAGIVEGAGKRNIVTRVGEKGDSSLKMLGTVAHELTHEIDRDEIGRLRSVSDQAPKKSIANRVAEASEAHRAGAFSSFDEAFRAVGGMEAVGGAGRELATMESLADTGKISGYRRVIEDNPELARRLGITDEGRIQYASMGIDEDRTLLGDVVDRFTGNRALRNDPSSLTTAYAAGEFSDVTKGRIGGFDEYEYRKLFSEAGIEVEDDFVYSHENVIKKLGGSDELLREIDTTHRVTAAATYSARIGGAGQDTVEGRLLAETSEVRARTSYKKVGDLTDEEKIKYEAMFNEVREQELPKGRFDVEVDTTPVVPRQVTGSIEDSYDELYDLEPKISSSLDEAVESIPPSRTTGRVVQASVDDAAESVARRIPPQPVLEVGSGKATRKTLQRIVESGMTAKRVIRSVI